jgi:phosphonate transport system substrate-binding protein
MKKVLTLVLTSVLALSLAACGTEMNHTPTTPTTPTQPAQPAAPKKDTLTVYFVPSRDAAEILTATAPLEGMLKAELAKLGYDFKTITIAVGSTYEAVGESMISGSADVGFLPGGTYALYSSDKKVDVILASTRGGLSKDSPNARDWNNGKPTEGDSTVQVTYYRSLMIAGPSATGRALARKVNAGTPLTWEDLNAATWCMQSPTSSAGTVYPSVYLFNNFGGRTATDLARVVRPGGYGPSIGALAAGNCDISTIYADARRDYVPLWAESRNGANIWDETDVIMVTDGIFNDTISVSNVTVDAALKEALTQAFINIIKTPEGLQVFKIYNHEGYQRVTDADYEGARIAQKILQG